jgi:hypothetical protein
MSSERAMTTYTSTSFSSWPQLRWPRFPVKRIISLQILPWLGLLHSLWISSWKRWKDILLLSPVSSLRITLKEYFTITSLKNALRTTSLVKIYLIQAMISYWGYALTCNKCRMFCRSKIVSHRLKELIFMLPFRSAEIPQILFVRVIVTSNKCLIVFTLRCIP